MTSIAPPDGPDFDKSPTLFPVRNNVIFLNSSGVSPLCSPAFDAEVEFANLHRRLGSALFAKTGDVVGRFRRRAAKLMNAEADDIAFVKSTAEAMNVIALGYPFEVGDEVITYVHEYPSNFHPWKALEKRGVVVKVLPNRNILNPMFDSFPVAWTMEDLTSLLSPRTKIIALSTVQFVSGYSAPLVPLAKLCRDRSIDLVLDAAQSLGCIPLDVKSLGVAAVASSGWKWLLGPIGSGVMYTSAELRSKLNHVLLGPDMMRQKDDYLDHSFTPVQTGARFEYSTTPFGLAHGLGAAIEQVHLRFGVERIWCEIRRLQDLLFHALDSSLFSPLIFPPENRSGIISAICPDPVQACRKLLEKGVVCSTRGGLLRIAPHFYVDESEIERAAVALRECFG